MGGDRWGFQHPPDGPMALVLYVLQEPGRGYLFAEVVVGVRGQAVVAVDESHEGAGCPQRGELHLLGEGGSAPH